MKTLANIMLVLNEAEFIDAAIRSVLPGVDQLIVIDQGSTDGTTDILEGLRQSIPRMEWVSTRGQTFLTRGEQFFRNLALDLVFTDWAMISDGDEIISDGWRDKIQPVIESGKYGAIRCNYFQLVGTSAYCTPDSPLKPEGGMRPIFFRKHDGLRAGDPMQGSKCHTAIIGVDPEPIAEINVDVWHAGYMKSDLTARFTRNIERGDWTACRENEAVLKAEFMKAARDEPLNLLPECMPISDEIRARMPASIRTPKFDCDYNPEMRRILNRRPK